MLGETAGAESFADDVLRAEPGAGDGPPTALVEQADEEAALAGRVDDDAAASALVGRFHRFPHQAGIDGHRIGLTRDGEEEPRLAPSVRLEFRLTHGCMFAADIKIRLQFVAQCLHETGARVSRRAVERGLTRLAIRGGGEESVLGDLHRVRIKPVEAEDELVYLTSRLPRVMLKPVRKAADCGSGCSGKLGNIGKRQGFKVTLCKQHIIDALGNGCAADPMYCHTGGITRGRGFKREYHW